MSDDPRPECDVETRINRLPIRAGSPMSRLFPPRPVPLLAFLVIALVAPRAAPAATDSAEAIWRGEWRPTEGCASRKTRPLAITVEGEKVIGRIGTAGSFVASMDGTGRVAGRGVIDGDMVFNIRGRRQGERIGGRFTGFYQEGDRQCDGVFEVTLVPPPEPPAAAVAPPPEPEVVAPEPEPEPEPEPDPAPTVAPAATAAPAIPGTMPRPGSETPRAVDLGGLPDDLDADTRARIERLAQLYIQGLITEAEYAAKRRQLLAMAGTAPPGGEPAPGRATAARLQQLDAMRAQGLIGDAEYQVLARRILAETGEVDVAAAPPPPPRPAADTPEVIFLRLFYNYCMLRVGDLTRIRDLSQQLAWQPLPENYKQAYRPTDSRDFDGWVLGGAAGQSVLIIHQSTRVGDPANVCAMMIGSGPDGERLAEKITVHFAPEPVEDRYEGRQHLRQYAITLPELGDMVVALIHGDDPARPALSLSVMYRRR